MLLQIYIVLEERKSPPAKNSSFFTIFSILTINMDAFEKLNLNFLKTFIIAAKVLSFTETARILHMTQSGVSQHIAKLEKTLQTKLFHRSGRKLILAKSGKQLMEFASLLQQEFEGILHKINAEEKELKGRVFIAMPGSLNYAMANYLLSVKKEKLSDVNFGLIIAPDKYIFEGLKENGLDIGFTTTEFSESDFVCKKIIEEEISLIGVRGTKVPKSLKELMQRDFLMHPGFQEYYEYWFKNTFPKVPWAFPKKSTSTMNNFENIIRAVSKGIGITVLPVSQDLDLLASGEIIKINPKKINVKQPIYICYRKTASFAVKYVGKICIHYLQQLSDFQ